MAQVDELAHVAPEERQQQRADVGTVDVGVCGDDDAVIAQLADVVLFAHPRAERGDQVADLFAGEDLVLARLMDVEDLSPQREDGLYPAIAPLLGAAPGGVALDDEELGQGGVLDRAVGELAGEGRVLEGRLAPGEVAGLAGRLAGALGLDRLHDHGHQGLLYN